VPAGCRLSSFARLLTQRKEPPANPASYTAVGKHQKRITGMTRISILLAALTLTAASAGTAAADCAADLAALTKNDMTATGSTTPDGGKTTNFQTGTSVAGGAVSKDGSTGPLESAGATTGETASAAAPTGTSGGTTTTPGKTAKDGSVSKDGSTEPLAAAQGGNDPNIAMSGQDVAAQQAGKPTAASETTNTAALEAAKAAADAGDEAACQKALQSIKG
jgi:hypothetical protein